MHTVIVYVHGLWLRGRESVWLRRRLTHELGAETRTFSYPSVTANLTDNARALARYLAAIPADTLHLVGHSLGGVVILKCFEDGLLEGNAARTSRTYASAGDAIETSRVDVAVGDAARTSPPGTSAGGAQARARPALALPPGRIVLLGSPVRGSRAAQRLAQLPFGRKIMGLTVHEELLAPHERRWNGARDLGIVAGDLAFGLGRLMGNPDAPNDGTILVEETQVVGATDQLTLRVSHSGMLFSAAVAKQTAAFLRNGRFER